MSQKKKILVVEDEKDVSTYLTALFENKPIDEDELIITTAELLKE